MTKSRQIDVAILGQKQCFFKTWDNAYLSLNIALVRNDRHAPSTAGWRQIFSRQLASPHGEHPTPRRRAFNNLKSCFISTDGRFSPQPGRADLCAAQLARRRIDRGPAGRESRPRPRPVNCAARCQSRNKRVSFAGHSSDSGAEQAT